MSEEIKIFCLLDNKLFKINHFKFAQRAKGNHVQRIKEKKKAEDFYSKTS